MRCRAAVAHSPFARRLRAAAENIAKAQAKVQAKELTLKQKVKAAQEQLQAAQEQLKAAQEELQAAQKQSQAALSKPSDEPDRGSGRVNPEGVVLGASIRSTTSKEMLASAPPLPLSLDELEADGLTPPPPVTAEPSDGADAEPGGEYPPSGFAALELCGITYVTVWNRQHVVQPEAMARLIYDHFHEGGGK